MRKIFLTAIFLIIVTIINSGCGTNKKSDSPVHVSSLSSDQTEAKETSTSASSPKPSPALPANTATGPAPSASPAESEASELSGSIHDAARMGDIQKVRAFLDKDPSRISSRDKLGNTALHRAALMGENETVIFLLEKGADINAKNNVKSTPLHVVALFGKPETAKLLIEKGADPNVSDDMGLTPFTIARTNNRPDMAEIFKNAGADKSHPIHQASAAGDTITVIELIDNNPALIDQRTAMGETPLYIASKNGHSKLAEYLIDRGADLNACSIAGEFPIITALKSNHYDIAVMLANKGANLDVIDTKGNTPYSVAQIAGRSDFVGLIKEKGGKTPHEIHEASGFLRCDKKRVLQILSEDPSLVNIEDDLGRRPLHYASARGDSDMVKTLIEQGADVNARCRQAGLTPLHLAAHEGKPDVIKVLLEKKADINARDMGGKTPLDYAEEKNRVSSLAILKNKGAKTF